MKVSIIIPTIGRETLWRVLDTLMAQRDESRDKEVEIIIVYDGQKSNKFIEQEQKYSSKLNLCFFATEKQLFSGGARNVGLDEATGEFIVFLGDDTIPTEKWMGQLWYFIQHTESEKNVLLGKTSWMPPLDQDELHTWLLNHGQFEYGSLEKGKIPTWKHFYTSNIAMHRSLIGIERFSPSFKGWGFEDTEFGYRLWKKGMKIYFNPEWEALHDHPQKWEDVLARTKNSVKNAKVFEALHPEVRLLPRGLKLWVLEILIMGGKLLTPFSQKIKRWIEWKQAWISDL